MIAAKDKTIYYWECKLLRVHLVSIKISTKYSYMTNIHKIQ